MDTLPYLMGGVGAAGATPPIGVGLAALFFKKKFSQSERDSAFSSILMGCMGITEGAIPYATADPLRVIPVYVVGSAVACMSGFLFGAQSHVPWGGLIALPVADNRLGYFAATMLGALTVAVLLWFVKRGYVEETESSNVDDGELEVVFEDL